MKTLKRRKAISSMLGTIMVISITLVLGGLLYAYSTGMFGNLTHQVDISPSVTLVVNPTSNSAYVDYSFANDGNIQVVLKSISVGNSTFTLGSNGLTLNPGQSVQGSLSLSGSYSAGSYYTVTISGDTSSGQPFSETLSVPATVE
ncbi:pilin subunit UpsA [Sulfuracidifex tepidarius]|nr:archaellin/type IV pilin N-terminal domain-containing protein [Sulfuracidifex tepidarius]